MNESLVAVGFGDFRFDVSAVVDAASRTWAGTTFVRATGPMAAVSEGQLQVQVTSADEPEVLAGFLPGGKGVSLDGTVEGMAQFIAWLTGLPGFPADGSVMVLGWTADEYPLTPDTTAEQMIRQFSA